jgi:hypothetical protein
VSKVAGYRTNDHQVYTSSGAYPAPYPISTGSKAVRARRGLLMSDLVPMSRMRILATPIRLHCAVLRNNTVIRLFFYHDVFSTPFFQYQLHITTGDSAAHSSLTPMYRLCKGILTAYSTFLRSKQKKDTIYSIVMNALNCNFLRNFNREENYICTWTHTHVFRTNFQMKCLRFKPYVKEMAF